MQEEKKLKLIYRIYCWKRKHELFMKWAKKKSRQSKEGVYQHQISEVKQWNRWVQKRENRRHESTFKILHEATEIQLLTNLAFKIVEFLPEPTISCLTARSLKYLAIRIGSGEKQQFSFLKNRFHSQLLPLTLIFGFFCRFSRRLLKRQSHIFLFLSRATKCSRGKIASQSAL